MDRVILMTLVALAATLVNTQSLPSTQVQPCEASCKMLCMYGYANEGCPRCRCAPDPCESVKCAGECLTREGSCEFNSGCPKEAYCAPAPTTTTVVAPCEASCRVLCPYGFLSEGCPRCKCAQNPCDTVKCDGECLTRERSCEFNSGCPKEAYCAPAPTTTTAIAPCEASCFILCPYGFLSEGCPRCRCAPNPCDSVKCDGQCLTRERSCEFNSGCPKEAYCAPAPTTTTAIAPCEASCFILCPYGFLSEGCPRCRCAPNPCDSVKCDGQCLTREISCEFNSGCPKEAYCAPAPTTTTVVAPCEASCRVVCPYGFMSEGCPRCKCAQNPCDSVKCDGQCLTRERSCEFNSGCPKEAYCAPAPTTTTVVAPCEASCRILCPYGFLSEGCPRCRCAPNPCESVFCEAECLISEESCEFSSGCPKRAKCAIDVVTVDPCEATCKMYCPYGYLSEGCPRCKCAPNPCESTNRICTKQCVTKEGTCEFKNGCPKEAICETEETKCQIERRNGLKMSQMISDQFVPSCDKNGNYMPQQCGMIGCWCVDYRGKALGDTPIEPGSFAVCVETKCERMRRESTIPNLMDNYIASCDEHGNFVPKQCTFGGCWCVDVNGEKTSESDRWSYNINCDPHRKPKTSFITFRILKDYYEIKHDLEGYGKIIKDHIIKQTAIPSSFIRNIKLRPGSIIVEISLEETNEGQRDLMAYSGIIVDMIQNELMKFELDGSEYVPDKDSLTMLHDNRPISCGFRSRFNKPKVIISVAAGFGVLVIVIVVVVVLFRKCGMRRRSHTFDHLQKVNFSNSLAVVKGPLSNDEKVDLGREPGVVRA